MGRKAAFRLGAVLLGLAPFVLLEVILRCTGIGAIDLHQDPFVGFAGTRPLFTLDPSENVYRIAPERQLFFRPDSFEAVKPQDEYRVFCLGGSTVQGRPYAIETSFTTWFELSLRAANPARPCRVVNCGGVSYASYRLVPVLEEVLQYSPDLIVLYTGHNEFLEDRTYAAIKQRPAALTRALQMAQHLHTFNLAQGIVYPEPAPVEHEPLPLDVQARLDYRGGLDRYVRDSEWAEQVTHHFAYNVRRMIELCQAAEVPIWIVDPVSNLRTSPPFKSLNRDDITEPERTEWNRLRQEASELYQVDLRQAINVLQQATAIDNQHAGLYYDLAKCYESLGELTQARDAYQRSLDLDICPLRITTPLRTALLAEAQSTGTPVIPVREMFERECRDGIPGGYLLVDHVHPSITGHQMIANLLVEQWTAQERFALPANFEADRRQLYDAHLATLDDKYYLQGQRRLEGLLKWAQGRATMLPGQEPLPRPDE